MNLLVVIIVCVIAISVGIIVMVRTCLKSKSQELAEKLNHISSYSEKSNYEQARDRLSALNEGVFIDIPTDLSNSFYGKIISTTQEQDFANHHR